ncbi:MAG TPA: 4-alpha-glucanotransferase [Pirellulales bacterium]|jgi:4-alpha-glucanotransferase|nr:4-alpha-glucanotransferase [Pirellulales bacterium]
MKPTGPGFVAPFPPGYSASGVLLHVTSLPSRYGIGDVGPAAFAWIDRLAAAGQAWWQLLPVGPTGFGHSPYQALSSFAANPLVISPDRLIEDGLLEASDCAGTTFPAEQVDFEQVIPFKAKILTRAYENFRAGARPDLQDAFRQFCHDKAELQAAPALFMALRAKYPGAHFSQWPHELARREPAAIARAKRDLADAIDEFLFGQFTLFRHWTTLKQYANERGVRLLGDLPIFVSPDSSDVWANPRWFLLDEQSRPTVVAGVPPDYFSADGQLWGNPIYDWDALKQTGYQWWIDRLRARLDLLDAIRIDHFRAFEAAWHIPAAAPTAASGHWVAGPGADFFDKLRVALGGLPLLAEDLGVITPAVTALRDQFQLPGMRVLQFAFNGDPNNPHLPHHCVHNGVVYTGTHDNDTTLGWYQSAAEHERQNLWNYLQRSPGEPREAVWEMIRLALSCEAALAIVPLQDVLGLGSSARMNIPGRADGQWRWRCTAEALSDPAWQRLHELTQTARRTPGP